MQVRKRRSLAFLYLPVFLLAAKGSASDWDNRWESEERREKAFYSTSNRGKIHMHGSNYGTEIMGFRLEPLYTHPHAEGDLPFEFTLTSLRGPLDITVGLAAKYARDNEKPPWAEKQYRKETILVTHWKPKKAGERFHFSTVWKLRYPWENRHRIKLELGFYNPDPYNPSPNDGKSDVDGELSYTLVYRGTQNETIKGNRLPWRRDLNFALPGYDPFKENSLASLRYGGERFGTYITEYAIHGRNFLDRYEDPPFGVIPLHEMYLRAQDYRDEWVDVTWKKGTMRIYGYTDDFMVGRKVYDYDKKQYFREFGIRADHRPTGTYFAYDTNLYISENGRDMKEGYAPQNGVRYYSTKHLFLPPNPTSEAREYQAELRLERFGEQNSDTFVHEFTIRKTRNTLSPVGNSNFVLKEQF